MQEARVQSKVWEDPTCLRATKPMCHIYWNRVLQTLKPVHLESRLCSKRSHSATRSPLTATREKPAQQQRPSTAKNKQINKIVKNTHTHKQNEISPHTIRMAKIKEQQQLSECLKEWQHQMLVRMDRNWMSNASGTVKWYNHSRKQISIS